MAKNNPDNAITLNLNKKSDSFFAELETALLFRELEHALSDYYAYKEESKHLERLSQLADVRQVYIKHLNAKYSNISQDIFDIYVGKK